MNNDKLEERVLREISGGSGEPLDTDVDVFEWPNFNLIGRFEVSGEWAVMSLKYLISRKINLHVNYFRLFNREHTEELTYNAPISRLSEQTFNVVLVDKDSEL